MRAWLSVFLLSGSLFATTYYIDYTNGLDSNNGTTTGTPFKHAPLMNGCTSTCAGVTLTAGSRVIFKGGIRWTGTDSFTWVMSASGSAGNPIYIGIDQTYYDTSGCQQVLAVTMTNAGSGYSVTSPPTPVFSAGAGSGAAGTDYLNSSGGIAGVIMTNRGTGYSSHSR